jgi:hypothetical protein
MTTARLPGSEWRLLAHEREERIEAENRGILDELVVDDWLHLEQMDVAQWCMRLGDARIIVTVGAQVAVDIERGYYHPTCGRTSTAGGSAGPERSAGDRERE